MPPTYTLTVCASTDGFIARHPGDNPATWASPEEQVRFFSDIAAADWAVMGRATHEVADRPDRHRIVFSASGGAGDWRRRTQIWVDPDGLTPAALPALVAAVRPLRRGLILGGTRVHDWFLAHRAIGRVHLTIEPITFGTGLPIFSGQSAAADPRNVFRTAGFAVLSDVALNATGTRYLRLAPADTAALAGSEECGTDGFDAAAPAP